MYLLNTATTTTILADFSPGFFFGDSIFWKQPQNRLVSDKPLAPTSTHAHAHAHARHASTFP